MKKLKTILQSNRFFLFIFMISLLYVLIFIFFCNHSSKYDISQKGFQARIVDMYVDGNYLSMVVEGKEKLQSTYYFKSLEEKETFLSNYHLGDMISITGNLKIPNNHTNPNLFNYKKYLLYHGIFYILEIETYHKEESSQNIFYYLKNSIIERIKKTKLSFPYLNALILGDDRYIGKDIQAKYETIGISHLFAISGMHITLLSGILLFFLKKIGFRKNKRYLFVMIFILFYIFLTGFSSSVLRASILFILLSINKILSLKTRLIDIYLLTISILLFINPFMIFQAGFLFSSIISGTLICFRHLIYKQKNYITRLFMTSLIAFVTGIPICLYYFYQMNYLSIIYNLFFVPFMSFILFPLTLLTFVFPILDQILYFFICLIENMANVCSSIPSVIYFQKPTIIVCIFYYLFIFIIFFQWGKNRYGIFLFILMLGIHYHYSYIFNYDYMILLDVGQGDSIFIHSKQMSVLIDTGGQIDYSTEVWQKRNYRSSIASNTIIPLLKSLGIKKLDYLILTHGDYDHMGEAINLVNNFKVEKVIFNCGQYNALEKDLISVLEEENIKYDSCIKELNIDDNQLYFLNTKEYDNENDNSNVIYTEIDNYKFLFMGDAGVERENDILDKYNLKNIDFLKVGHHGSNTSSSKSFIDSVNPKYSLISVGKNNRYGHPKESVLDILSNSKIYRTDLDGSIEIKLNKNGYKISTCSP